MGSKNQESGGGVRPALALLGTILLLIGVGASGAEAPPAAGAAGPETLRTCGEAPFSLSVFDQPAGYEKKDTGIAKALRAVIRIKWLAFPKRGWRLVYKGERFAQVVAGDLDSEYREAITFKREKGKWAFWRSGGCDLEAYRPGAAVGVWTRTRGQDYSRTTTSLSVDVYEMGCNSGRPPRGRVLEPTIEYSEDSIVVTYFIKPNPGFHTCPTAPPVKKLLKLSEPLGDRDLLDGSIYPYPKRMSAPGPEGFFDRAPRAWFSPSCRRVGGSICVTQIGPSRVREGESATFRVRIKARERLTGVKLRAATGVSGEVKRFVGSMRAGRKRTLTFRARCPGSEGPHSSELTAVPTVSFTTHRRGKARTLFAYPRPLVTCVPR